MLGSGHPFLVEVLNVRSLPSATEVQQIAEKINSSEMKYVWNSILRLNEHSIILVVEETGTNFDFIFSYDLIISLFCRLEFKISSWLAMKYGQ
jgi:hypothetical protein